MTVQELLLWLERHKLIRLESEGRDRDVDIILENEQSRAQGEDETPADESLKNKPLYKVKEEMNQIGGW